MSQVSGIVFVNVSVIVFVFVIVFLLVRSCPLITLIKGHKSLGSLFEGALLMYLSLSLPLSLYMSLSLSFFCQVMCPHHPDQMSQR